MRNCAKGELLQWNETAQKWRCLSLADLRREMGLFKTVFVTEATSLGSVVEGTSDLLAAGRNMQ